MAELAPPGEQLLREALEHIAKTARASRTSTRRIRWIEQRAEFALAGKAYDDEAFDLPQSVDSAEKRVAAAVRRATAAEAQVAALTAAPPASTHLRAMADKLEAHNRWRRGDDEQERAVDGAELGRLIDDVVAALRTMS